MIFLHDLVQHFDDARCDAFLRPMRGRGLDIPDQFKCVIVDGDCIRECAADIDADSYLHCLPPYLIGKMRRLPCSERRRVC